MNNEQKAREIAIQNYCTNKRNMDISFKSAMKMADWKDQQVKDAIQKVRSDYMCLDNRSDSAICALDSVLNVLKEMGHEEESN